MGRKKAFTLVELMVVLIIVGILGTLGLAQYSRSIEKSRVAEAKDAIGHIRKLASLFYQQNQAFDTATAADLGIGVTPDLLPAPAICNANYYFRYHLPTLSGPSVTISADRCGGGGVPIGKGGASSWGGIDKVWETINFATGADAPDSVAIYR